jgi:hypothetical protein
MSAESPISERPWRGLPPAMAAALRPELPGLGDEIIAAISRGVPAYARPLEGPFGQTLRVGVAEALRQFVELIERPEEDRGAGRNIYVNLGRTEMLQGRSLEALLSAYRLGARVAWRRLAAAGKAAGFEPDVLFLLAESIFAYIDELSGESIEGYAREQSAAAGELQRLQQRLAGLLIQDPPVDSQAVEAASQEAAWPLPRRLAAVVTEEQDPDRLALRLGAQVIAVQMPPHVCALVPDPDAPGRRAELDSAFAGRAGVLGPSVHWRAAAVSATRARAALGLLQDGAIADQPDGLVCADDHSLALLLNADRRLATDVAASALAPLDDETGASRDRLAATLFEWLRHRGRTEVVAEALHVHPQTVRYRLGRLRELYGERLEDPDERFTLELALRAGGSAAHRPSGS